MELRINTLPREDWERLADQCRAGLQQRWAYGAAVEAMGRDVLRVTICDNDRVVGLAQVVRRRFAGLLTRGPLWPQPMDDNLRRVALDLLRGGLRAHGVRLLAVTPPDARDMARGLAVITPATLAYLPIHPPDRARLHGKWRNRLVAAEMAGLNPRVLQNQTKPIQWLLNLDHAQQKARGYRALPAQFTKAWLKADPASALTLTIDQDAEPVAAMMMLRHGTTATYHIGWTNTRGRALHAHNLLLWHAAKRLSSMGVQRIDLGTLDTVNTPGLARFKLGTGAAPHRLGHTRVSF